MSKKLKKSYVYYIYVDDVVRYVGKGHGPRIDDHMKIVDQMKLGNMKRCRGQKQLYHKLLDASLNGAFIVTEKIKEHLTNDEAEALEEIVIAGFEHHFPNQIWNILPGGRRGIPPGNAKFIALVTEVNREIGSRPEVRKIRSIRSKEGWANEESRARREAGISAVTSTQEFSDACSEAVQKRRLDDPTEVIRIGLGMVAYLATPEGKAEHARRMDEIKESAQFIENCSKASLEVWQRPGHAEKHAKAMDEVRARPGQEAKRIAAAIAGSQTPQAKENSRQASIKMYSGEDGKKLRGKLSVIQTKLGNRPEERAARSARRKAHLAKPGVKEAIGAASRLAHAKRRYLKGKPPKEGDYEILRKAGFLSAEAAE